MTYNRLYYLCLLDLLLCQRDLEQDLLWTCDALRLRCNNLVSLACKVLCLCRLYLIGMRIDLE